MQHCAPLPDPEPIRLKENTVLQYDLSYGEGLEKMVSIDGTQFQQSMFYGKGLGVDVATLRGEEALALGLELRHYLVVLVAKLSVREAFSKDSVALFFEIFESEVDYQVNTWIAKGSHHAC